MDWRGFEPLTSRALGPVITCEASVTTTELPARRMKYFLVSFSFQINELFEYQILVLSFVELKQKIKKRMLESCLWNLSEGRSVSMDLLHCKEGCT